MATYAIGDVQGCYSELSALLRKIRFDGSVDRLWFLGDLINRGKANLEVLRLVMSLGGSAVTVLGNHDLHFLAICCGGHSPNRGDTFTDVLAAPDVREIVDWYRQQPLLVEDADLGYVMTHAGIPHIWSLDEARLHAREVEAVLRSAEHPGYFKALYGNSPDIWQQSLVGMDRWRMITNYFTRMRLMYADGRLDFAHKGALADAPENLVPWFEYRARAPIVPKLLFGHWAALEGVTDNPNIIALDTGCVWGRCLTALCLDSAELISVPAVGPRDR